MYKGKLIIADTEYDSDKGIEEARFVSEDTVKLYELYKTIKRASDKEDETVLNFNKDGGVTKGKIITLKVNTDTLEEIRKEIKRLEKTWGLGE